LQQRPFCRISCCSVLLFYCLRAAAIDGVPCAACVFTSVDISALCCCSCNSTHKCCLMSSETWRVTDLSLRGIAIQVLIFQLRSEHVSVAEWAENGMSGSRADIPEKPHAGSGVVRIDPLHFLAGCRTRRLNQSIIS